MEIFGFMKKSTKLISIINCQAITFKAGSCVENRLSDCVERSGAGVEMKFYYGD